MPRLGSLLGLPRQLIEFCQSVVGGFGLHMACDDAAEHH
jgi:hypothetical protein